jgi:hypothetical protein
LHPGEPIEHEIRFLERYVFPGDAHVRALRSVGPDVHLRLFGPEGNLIAEGEGNANGETLGLTNISAEQFYALEVMPRQLTGRQTRLRLEWDAVQ